VTPCWDGLLLLDKPPGPTSHDIVDRVRRATHTRRVGHAGTLDPPATGLLVAVLGRATRLVRFLPDAPKGYSGTFRLGVTTATDDLTGATLTRHDGPLPAHEQVVSAAARFVGSLLQTPPSISARSVGGKRLYRLARRGRAITAPAVRVQVERLEIEPLAEPGLYAFSAEVSAGTYVRSLVRDLGWALECGAAVDTLRRTRIGPLGVEDALLVSPDGPIDREEARRRLVPIDGMPFALPGVVARHEDAEALFLAGRPVEPEGEGFPASGLVVVRSGAGRVIGVGEVLGGLVRPRVALALPPADRL